MFTGIIEAIGAIARIERSQGDVRLHVDSGSLGLDDAKIGDSISVAGVCLTATGIDGAVFSVDVSGETLSRTTLGDLRAGDAVNLEKAMRLSDRLGGHLVAGHIDGVGRVVSVEPDARSQRWLFELPPELARYLAPKGSICIDGVSLTVNEVDGARFGVNLIPHTIDVTTFKARRAGDAVNIEVDLLARYIEQLLPHDRGTA
ncbi:MAG: riboflavin synthase [Rhodanobacteraceae bacterium]